MLIDKVEYTETSIKYIGYFKIVKFDNIPCKFI